MIQVPVERAHWRSGCGNGWNAAIHARSVGKQSLLIFPENPERLFDQGLERRFRQGDVRGRPASQRTYSAMLIPGYTP